MVEEHRHVTHMIKHICCLQMTVKGVYRLKSKSLHAWKLLWLRNQFWLPGIAAIIGIKEHLSVQLDSG